MPPSIDLLWDQILYPEMHFVLVEINDIQSLLISTCLTLELSSFIQLYSYRFRIECAFQELKQQTDAFCCCSGSYPCHRDASGIILHCNGNCTKYFHLFYWKSQFQSEPFYQLTPAQRRISEVTIMHYFQKHFSGF